MILKISRKFSEFQGLYLDFLRVFRISENLPEFFKGIFKDFQKFDILFFLEFLKIYQDF